jgi:hypothetical protein
MKDWWFHFDEVVICVFKKLKNQALHLLRNQQMQHQEFDSGYINKNDPKIACWENGWLIR